MLKNFKMLLCASAVFVASAPLPVLAAARQAASASVPSLPPLQPTPAGVGANVNSNVNFQSNTQPSFVPLTDTAPTASAAPLQPEPAIAAKAASGKPLNFSDSQRSAALWAVLIAILLGLLWFLIRQGSDDSQ